MKSYYSESVDMPVAVDDISSPTTVYVNSEIQENERADEEGKVQTYYKYKVSEYTRQEWEKEKEIEYMLDLDFRLSMVELGLA
jgi:hypothetical protein